MNFFSAKLIPAITEVILTHPMEVWKTRLQAKKQFRLRYSFKGFIPRAIGFIPMRTTFWFLHDTAKLYKLNIIKSSALISSGQTLIDFPIDIIKTRQIIHQPIKPNIIKLFSFHYMRNFTFIYTLLNTQQYTHKIHPIYSTILGCSIGAVLSQPFDVWKMNTYLSKPLSYPSFTGIIPRLLITSIGITTGTFIHACFNHL